MLARSPKFEIDYQEQVDCAHVLAGVTDDAILLASHERAWLLDLDGREQCVWRREEVNEDERYETQVHAVQRTPLGWQSLHSVRGRVYARHYLAGQWQERWLDMLDGEKIGSAVWSACGRYLAISSSDACLSLLEMPHGRLCWHHCLIIEDDGGWLEPMVKHRLVGWQDGDRRIVSMVDMLLTRYLAVWDAATGDLIAGVAT